MASPSYTTSWRRFSQSIGSGTTTSIISLTGGYEGTAEIDGLNSYIALGNGSVISEDLVNPDSQSIIFSTSHPNAVVTGIQYRVPMLFRQDSNNGIVNLQTSKATLTPIRYTSIINAQNDIRQSTGTSKEYNGSELVATYDSGGPGTGATDPLNFTTVYGGEGEFFGWDASNPITYYAFMGIEIKITAFPESSYHLAIGGKGIATYAAPAIRLFYKQPSITVTTGKLNITQGKVHIGY